jgi:FAD-dependent oxidoreductase domain-containing protein 1
LLENLFIKFPELLKTEKNPNPTASMVTNGYLLMFGPEHAEEQYRALENHKECDAGTKNIKGSELSKVVSYVNNEGLKQQLYTIIKVRMDRSFYVSIALLKVKL